MSANPERGEVEIELDGNTYVMRPSWAALVAIERSIHPRTVVQLITEYRDRGLSSEETAIIVTEGIKAYGKATDNKLLQAFSASKVGELLFDAGFGTALGPCLRFLMNVSGGAKKKKAEDPGILTE